MFTGDTLFQGGCGRFFEGNGAEMHAALSYLGTLPDATVAYNGHEYTKGNLAFAKCVDSDNPALNTLQSLVSADEVTTGRSTIGDEKEWNVFMRLNSDAVRYVAMCYTHEIMLIGWYRKATGATADTPVETVMDTLRDMKNNFKG